MQTPQSDVYQRALARERNARKEAERILEAKSTELYHLTQALTQSNAKLEVLLQEKKSELSGLIHHILDPYILVDLDGNIIKLNKAAVELFDYDNLIKKAGKVNLIHLVSPEDRMRLSTAFMDMVEDGYIKEIEVKITAADGTVRDLQINASVLYDNNNNPTAAQGIARDITALKQLEAQKDKLYEKLESQNEELNEYAHVVSHDLKSPLRSVNALIQWIKTDDKNVFDPSMDQYFGMIDKSVKKMENLISDILRYSKSEVDYSEETLVNVGDLISEVQEHIDVPANISIVIESQMPTVQVQKGKLEQVIQNLMTNAIKFTPQADGLITWKYKSVDGKHQFAIRDNGIGIEEKYFDKIFKVFQSLKASEHSTGIGLSIVKKVLISMGGEIWLQSTLGKGTTFYFTLPQS